MRAKVIAYCEELSLLDSCDELLAAFEGREHELLNNLAIRKAKVETIAEVKMIIDELALSTKENELLSTFDGREKELLENLTKMKANKEIEAKNF